MSSRRIELKNVRLGHPSLFEPKGFGRDNQNPAYQATFYIDKESRSGRRNIAKIDAAMEAAEQAGAEKIKSWSGRVPKIKRSNRPTYDGDDDFDGDREPKPEERGKLVLRSRSYEPPLVLDQDMEEMSKGQRGTPYGGCYVDAIVEFWAQDYQGVPRVNCELKGVRFRADGEAFGGKTPIDADAFSGDDDDEDDEPAPRKKRPADDDEPAPRKKRPVDDEDDEPAPRKKRPADDEDDEPAPRSKRRPVDDEDDEPAPRSKRRPVDDEDDEPAPRSKRRRPVDDEV